MSTHSVYTSSPLDGATIDVIIGIGQSLMLGPPGNSALHTNSNWDNHVLAHNSRQGATYKFAPRLTVRECAENFNDRRSPLAYGARHIMEVSGWSNIYLSTMTQGGINIAGWIDPAHALTTSPAGFWPSWIDASILRINQLEALGYRVRLRGVVMFQGHSDCDGTRAPKYADNLRVLRTDARALLATYGWHDVPWYQLVSPTWTEGAQADWVSVVQAAQRTVVDEDVTGRSYRAESDDPLGEPITWFDYAHPDADSTERIGVEMGKMILAADVTATKV